MFEFQTHMGIKFNIYAAAQPKDYIYIHFDHVENQKFTILKGNVIGWLL